MTYAPDRAGFCIDDRQRSQHIRLALLICFYVVCCCVSFRFGFPHYREYYILYDANRLHYAIAAVAALALISPLFVYARFSFGYFVGFYFYTMILGYLWLNCFSQFGYDHEVAGVSAALSAVAFLLPALTISSPIRQRYVMSGRAVEQLLTLILVLTAGTALVGAGYNFRLVSIEDIYGFRDQLQFPTIVDYLMGSTTSVLLPYAFACFLALKKPWRAGTVLLISLAFYPVTLSKIALFMPAWLVMLALLSKIFEVRVTAILSLLLPMLLGVFLIVVFGETTRNYFNNVNMRMIMVPSSAMDIYNEYFARHDLTHFCQMWIIKPFVPCALEHPLSVEMQNNYALGNFNASLFATEGIASVGLVFAPVSVFVGGLVVALGNRLSAGLPPRFILTSGAVLPLVLLNVPLTTVVLTHGMWLLFLLWYITPREMFERK
jgi:hypothetical protein